MVAINFKNEFAEDVESGKKRQTIRKKARCKPGDALQLYTGMRTKKCRKLADAICTSVAPVTIDHCSIYSGQMKLLNEDQIARDDGFEDFTAMAEWFEKQYGVLPFEGELIKWKPSPQLRIRKSLHQRQEMQCSLSTSRHCSGERLMTNKYAEALENMPIIDEKTVITAALTEQLGEWALCGNKTIQSALRLADALEGEPSKRLMEIGNNAHPEPVGLYWVGEAFKAMVKQLKKELKNDK